MPWRHRPLFGYYYYYYYYYYYVASAYSLY